VNYLLKKYACYEQNEFMPFEFDEKLEVKYPPDEVSQLLKRFVDVKAHKECNLVKYDVIYG